MLPSFKVSIIYNLLLNDRTCRRKSTAPSTKLSITCDPGETKHRYTEILFHFLKASRENRNKASILIFLSFPNFFLLILLSIIFFLFEGNSLLRRTHIMFLSKASTDRWQCSASNEFPLFFTSDLSFFYSFKEWRLIVKNVRLKRERDAKVKLWILGLLQRTHCCFHGVSTPGGCSSIESIIVWWYQRGHRGWGSRSLCLLVPLFFSF